MLWKTLVSLAVVLAVGAGGTMGILADDVGVSGTTTQLVSETESETTSSIISQSATNSESETSSQSESTTQSESTSTSETTSKGNMASTSVTISKEVISDGEIENGNKLKLDKNAEITENDYISVWNTEYEFYYKAKKSGYFDLLCKDEGTGKFCSVSTDDRTLFSTPETALKWQKYNADDLINLPITVDYNYWIYYSENRTDISAVLEIDISDYINNLYGNVTTTDYDVSFTYSTEPKGGDVELTMNCEAVGGIFLNKVRYYEWNKKKEIYVYKGYLHSFAPDTISETLKHTFTKNGKYKIVLEGSGSYFSEIELNITECDDGVIFSDDDKGDTKAPKITANIDSAKNLKVGTDTCKIVIKSDEPVYLFINDIYKAELVTEYEFYAGGNGEYLVRGSDENGNTSEIKVVVNAFAETKTDKSKFKVTPLSDLERTWGKDGKGKVYHPEELSIDYNNSSADTPDSQSPQTGVFHYMWMLLIAAVCGLFATYFVIRYNKKRSEEDNEISSVTE